MTTAVTGVSGFIGAAIARRLEAEGRPVVGLTRQPAAAATLEGHGIRAVVGDLLDRSALRRVLAGCDVLYHAAGLVAFCLPDPRSLYQVNVGGTRSLLEAAVEAGIRRVIYTSSVVTIGEAPGTVAREETTHRGWYLSHYERSKVEAERVALSFRQKGIEVVCLNPSSVQGPGRLTGTAHFFLDYLNGRLPWFFGEWVSLCYLNDCVEGHVQAETRGRDGERYILSSPPVRLTELLRHLGEITGLSERPRRLPAALAWLAGVALEGWGHLAGSPPRLCREQVRTILHGYRCDSSKAERELGLQFTPLAEALRHTVRWYVREGHVKRSLPMMPLRGADP